MILAGVDYFPWHGYVCLAENDSEAENVEAKIPDGNKSEGKKSTTDTDSSLSVSESSMDSVSIVSQAQGTVCYRKVSHILPHFLHQ